MRNWSFTFNTEEEYNVAGKMFFELFKDSMDYKNKKIIIANGTDKDGTKLIFISIEDSVPGSFITSISNAFEKNLENNFTVIKADCKDINVKLPKDCKIYSWYTDETPSEAKKNEGN